MGVRYAFPIICGKGKEPRDTVIILMIGHAYFGQRYTSGARPPLLSKCSKKRRSAPSKSTRRSYPDSADYCTVYSTYSYCSCTLYSEYSVPRQFASHHTESIDIVATRPDWDSRVPTRHHTRWGSLRCVIHARALRQPLCEVLWATAALVRLSIVSEGETESNETRQINPIPRGRAGRPSSSVVSCERESRESLLPPSRQADSEEHQSS